MAETCTQAVIIANTQNLFSAGRDVFTAVKVCDRLGIEHRDILVCRYGAGPWDQLPPDVRQSTNLKDAIQAIRKATGSLLLTISAHGYQQRDTSGDEADGKDESFVFAGGRVVDDDIKLWFTKSEARITALMDTCHSGTLSDLPTVPRADYQRARVLVLSACADAQCDMDDISDYTGYGGGLMTKLSDHVLATGTLHRTQLIDGATSRLARAGQTVVITGLVASP